MTRIRQAPLALSLVAALALAACGNTTPAPSAGAPTATPAGGPATAAPGSTAVASRSPAGSAQTGASFFGTAADKLDALTSYRFTVNIDSASAGKTQKIAMTGTVVNSPTKGYALEMDNSGEKTGVVVIGADAWMKRGSAPYVQLSAAMADTVIQALSVFRPEKLFALAFGINSDKFARVADEDRNGVPSTRFKGDDSLSAVYGGMFGVTASFASDVWIARSGGFLVASEIRTTGTAASASGSYSSVVNITNVNDPANKVDRPS